jgi:hypothetical protein
MRDERQEGERRVGGTTIMAMSTTKLTYYNGIMWHMVLLPSGTRAVWPSRLDGRPVPGAATRYYRTHTRVGAEHREPALAGSRA